MRMLGIAAIVIFIGCGGGGNSAKPIDAAGPGLDVLGSIPIADAPTISVLDGSSVDLYVAANSDGNAAIPDSPVSMDQGPFDVGSLSLDLGGSFIDASKDVPLAAFDA